MKVFLKNKQAFSTHARDLECTDIQGFLFGFFDMPIIWSFLEKEDTESGNDNETKSSNKDTELELDRYDKTESSNKKTELESDKEEKSKNNNNFNTKRMENEEDKEKIILDKEDILRDETDGINAPTETTYVDLVRNGRRR
jgi:hypothetical protein